jgi:hypothetical protein
MGVDPIVLCLARTVPEPGIHALTSLADSLTEPSIGRI